MNQHTSEYSTDGAERSPESHGLSMNEVPMESTMGSPNALKTRNKLAKAGTDIKVLKILESKYNQAELDQYLMGIKQMHLDKKLDFKRYFNQQ